MLLLYNFDYVETQLYSLVKYDTDPGNSPY